MARFLGYDSESLVVDGKAIVGGNPKRNCLLAYLFDYIKNYRDPKARIGIIKNHTPIQIISGIDGSTILFTDKMNGSLVVVREKTKDGPSLYFKFDVRTNLSIEQIKKSIDCTYRYLWTKKENATEKVVDLTPKIVDPSIENDKLNFPEGHVLEICQDIKVVDRLPFSLKSKYYRIQYITKNAVLCTSERIRMAYSTSEHAFLMTKEEWKYARSKGHPLVCNITKNQIVTESTFNEDLQTQSFLGQLGYQVGKTSKLTIKQRHRILEIAIEYGRDSNGERVTPSRIIDFIQWLISRHQKEMYKYAVSDWKDDINFLTTKFQRRK